MRRLLAVPLLLAAALLAGSCKHGHCGSGLPTDPGRFVGEFNCSNSAQCAAVRQPGDPETRCYLPEGGTISACELPGPPCKYDADCHTGQGCVVSIELLSGRGAMTPLTTCQSNHIPCASSDGFDPGANF